MNIIYKYHDLLIKRLASEGYTFDKRETETHLILFHHHAEIIIPKFEHTYGMFDMPDKLVFIVSSYCNNFIRLNKIDSVLE